MRSAFVGAGGSEVQAPTDMTWRERVTQVRDPDGNLATLGQRPLAAPNTPRASEERHPPRIVLVR